MPEPLVARSALRAHVAPVVTASVEPGVTLRERSGLTLATVSALGGRDAELADAVRSAFGLELPTTPKRVAAGEAAFVWAGPGKWLATSTGAADFASLPAGVSDQSDGRTVLSVSGPLARETLATLIAVDLHPRAFAAGDVALTHAASIAVHLWRVDDEAAFELAVFRSYAATLWRWLVHAGAARNIDARLDG
ncbi:sarcosine oxidase subunit gamma [Hansschlegelia plantiphila]|uniref:Sarcosine oxidase subunit gamma n=1 Tax=Hansschlegelia plantiphila TaxID=374655 RepID=A0A9W6MUD3_9HYPH|nr:sarcosine oxidase subunit gamma family protein [Hansschlegelia plantiphila]GLK66550.1 sarcosine oxidase subunit gamma [Hansschlegelia plantiphila]